MFPKAGRKIPAAFPKGGATAYADTIADVLFVSKLTDRIERVGILLHRLMQEYTDSLGRGLQLYPYCARYFHIHRVAPCRNTVNKKEGLILV